ncbi:MAG: hypothetical protein JNK84_20300 [Phreatobacter sp.]|uniref:hypothetical protein n=1 Tax=Phreatobacter sp. TaxID=1966341 RepID=UPI001A468D2E|nr:hypothetical protein [Phreatobacter sp.]MBL8571424.1 hypothetical protein [Phreatobacter sp.]
MRPLRSLLTAAALVLAAAPAAAQSIPPAAQGVAHGDYHLGLLNDSQRADLMRRLDSYAVVEVFLRACGRPPALERRIRHIVSGCIRPDSIETLAGHYRRAVASRENLRWDCVSTGGRQMIEKSETAIRLTVADLTRLCRRE